MSLTFTHDGHRYRLDGKPCPGVTTLLGAGLPKPALPRWAARTVSEYVADNLDDLDGLRRMGRGPMVDALTAIPWQRRDEAAVRGTDVHALAERLVHGDEVDVPEHLADHVTGYARWLDVFQPDPILTERPVANRTHWYAGRFDLIARMGDTVWMLDVKTSKGVYGETALQLAAYRGASFYVTEDGEEYPLPDGIERLGVLHVTAGGTELIPMQSDDEPWRMWVFVAHIGRNVKRLRDYRGEPITDPEGLSA